jgi:hypothetical protein
MGGSIMIVKKNTTKYSVEYTLIQGDKVFQFREYTEDFWADRKMYPNGGSIMNKHLRKELKKN